MFRPISFDSVQSQASANKENDQSNEPKLIKPIAKTSAPPISFAVQAPDKGHVTVYDERCGEAGLLHTASTDLLESDSLLSTGFDHSGSAKIEMELLSSADTRSSQGRDESLWPTNRSFPSGRYGAESAEQDIRRMRDKKVKSACAPIEGTSELISASKPPSLRRKPSSTFGEASIHAVALPECPTITSIQTASSGVSSRDSDILKPIPRRPLQPHGHEMNDKNDDYLKARKRSVTPNAVHRQDSEQQRGSEQLLGPEHHYPNNNAHFREVVNASRGKADSEPNIKDKMKLFSSSSNNETDEKQGPLKKLSQRLDSSDSGRLSLRLFEKKHSQGTEDEANPWFQHRLPSSNDCVVSELGTPAAEQVQSKKKRLKKKIGLRFRKDQKDFFSRKSLGSTDSVSNDQVAQSLVGSDDSMSTGTDNQTDNVGDMSFVESDLKVAISEKRSLEDVLHVATGLSDRPSEEISSLLYKFLATTTSVVRAIELILGYVEDGIDLDSTRPYRRTRYDSYREALVHIFITGPKKLRKAILSSSKAMGLLLSFLAEDSATGMIHVTRLEAASFKTCCAAKVLNSLLSENAAEITDHIASKKGLLHLFVRNHIHIPEVSSFVSQFCAENALAETVGEEHRYGAPNVAGIMLISSEGICNLLVHMFAEACRTNGSVRFEELRWQIQVSSIGCLLELSKRAIVVPQFSKTNSSYNSKTIKAVNAALTTINSFENRNRVELLLEAGLGSISLDWEPPSTEMVIFSNNAAVCALSFPSDLLTMVRTATESKSMFARRTIGAVKTDEIEHALLTHLELMMKLLNSSLSTVLGRLKAAIVKTLGGLFSSNLDATRSDLIRLAVPEALLHVVEVNKACSILHQHVLDCMAISMGREDASDLQASWFQAMQKKGGIFDCLARLVDEDDDYGSREEREVGWECYRSTLLDVGFIVSAFSQNLKRADFKALFVSEQQYIRFTNKIEQGLVRIEEARRGPCGGPKPERAAVSVLANAESLAAMLDDVNAV